ncbi:BBE domain-containing protein [Nocardia sp. CA-120079]
MGRPCNWEREYYGANCERLRQVKARYDPHEVFSFEQSVSLSRESTV